MESESVKVGFYFCFNNPYGSRYEDTFNYSKDVMMNLFPDINENNFTLSCVLNEDILKTYSIIINNTSEELSRNNINSEKFPEIKLLQYINLIFS